MDEREIARLMQLDFSEGTETFRDALLARCLDALRPENQMRELDDDDLDIIDKNEQMKKPENTILLGYNDFDLLCYDYTLGEYLIIDRNDFKVTDKYGDVELDYALSKIFNF